MVTMAKSKKTRPIGRPRTEIETDTVATRIPLAVKQALIDLAAKNRRTVAAEIFIAIEERLSSLGLLPPPDAE